MTPTLTDLAPIVGVPDGKRSKDPSVRQAWLDQRRGGITATEVRDWLNPSDKRAIITAKVTGIFEDLSHIPRIRHGNYREPMIADWVRAEFGIEPCENVYARGDNPRHMASPDGMSLDPFSRVLLVGTDDALLSEIKTSVHDLTPGPLDDARVVLQVTKGSHFDKSGYYDQMQWQMYVMNATRTLFVWENHDGKIDRETGTYTPVGPPQWAWIPRDERTINRLVKRADAALEEIDAARLAHSVGMPPASALPSEDAILMADLFSARSAEAVAVAAKAKAFDALKAKYTAPDADDLSIDAGFGTLTVSTGKDVETVEVDEEAARAVGAEVFERVEEAAAELAAAKAELAAWLVPFTTKTTTAGRRILTITERKIATPDERQER